MSLGEIIPPPEAPQPVKRSAIRWLHNGDHPDDHVGEVLTDPVHGGTYWRREGAVVRYFRHPDFPDDQRHVKHPGGCFALWHDHGWIDEGADGLTVCPGDLIVDLPSGGHEVLKLGRPAYRDRNDHYVPAGLSPDRKPQFVEVSEGNKGRNAATLEIYIATAAHVVAGLLDKLEGGDGGVAPGGDIVHAARQWLATMAEPVPYEEYRAPKTAPLGLAQSDEQNRSDGSWWWADVSGDGSHWSRFDGHRVQVDVELHTSNHREVNEWKGRDEVRAGGEWLISLNRQPVYGDYMGGTDVARTLRRIADKVDKLTGDGVLGLDHTDPRPYREQLTGRRIYYREVPAVISSTVLDQGCIIIKPVGRPAFPRHAYDLDSEPDGTGHGEQDLYDEGEEGSAKVHIDSPDIWWWRKRPFSPDEPDGRYRPNRDTQGTQGVKEETS